LQLLGASLRSVKMQKVVLDLFLADPIGRTAVVLGQRRDRADVGLARALGHAADREIVFKLLAQRAHRVSPHVIAGTFPRESG